MAEMLSEQYKSVYSTPKESLPEAKEIFQGDRTRGHCLHNVTFDEEDINPFSASPVFGQVQKYFLENLLLDRFLCWRDISRDLFF